MRSTFHSGRGRFVVHCSLVLAGIVIANEGSRADEVVTNVLQIRRLTLDRPQENFLIRLQGDVWWANPAQGRLVLKDESGVEELEMDLLGPPPQAGQRVRLEGNGMLAKKGGGFRIGAKGPLVDNNGVHGMTEEKTGRVYLKAGLHPIRVDWFNGVEKYGLEVEYEGPGLTRQRIPDSVLFRAQMDSSTGQSNLVNGVDYRCYEVIGEALPDFTLLSAAKGGTTRNFDLSVINRQEHVGLQFSGYIEISRDGVYTFHTRSDDGSRLYVGEPSVHLEVIGQAALPEPRQIAIGQTLHEQERGQWASVEGRVTFVRQEPEGLYLEMNAGAGRICAEVADDAGLSQEFLLNRRVRAVGFCQSAVTVEGQRIPGVLLVSGRKEIELTETPHDFTAGTSTNDGALKLLTTAAEVHRLKREEAERRYPVRIRGVVTSVLPEHQAFTIQDSTRGLYVEDHSEIRSGPPQIGEFLEVEGTTLPLYFAPIVTAGRVTSLGEGHMPDPVRPTWDQLMNGSLDAQYVEIQGIVTAVEANIVTLLARGGVIKVELRLIGYKPIELGPFEDALVRVRGCLFATWDYVTHQVKMGEVRLNGADILVDQPAPTDLFSTPRKTAAELRLFDPQAGVFQRVRVSGQVIYAHDPEYFMADNGKGVRFISKKAATFQPGDELEVVGFPELLGSASPVLREAIARKTGQAALPAANRLSSDKLIDADHDSTRVEVEGKLVNVRTTPAEQVLEMQNGVRNFMARLGVPAEAVRSLIAGSKLELTGVYAGRGGNRATGQDIASFELLLLSPADIKVLARPPWWTLERLLIIVGALACVLFAALVWIKQLHRQVEERTGQLEKQIRERQRVEQQRALEHERSRVAQDLHDDLGAGLTEISILGKQARSPSANAEQQKRYLDEMDEKARQMVGALDEIVWAMNPAQDSLDSLVSYFCLYADRFLKLANISWQLEEDTRLPDFPINSLCRHELFLAFKEALNNVVRHSEATEVCLSIQLEDKQLRLSVADNGRGLAGDIRTANMDGLSNMRARMEKIGGRFECSSKPGVGTTLHFWVPANN